MIRATLKCEGCGNKQVVDLGDGYTMEMAKDFCELINGMSRFFLLRPTPGNVVYSSRCCQAAIVYRVEELTPAIPDDPECPGPECTRCSGEYCDNHYLEACDCDSVERHSGDR